MLCEYAQATTISGAFYPLNAYVYSCHIVGHTGNHILNMILDPVTRNDDRNFGLLFFSHFCTIVEMIINPKILIATP